MSKCAAVVDLILLSTRYITIVLHGQSSWNEQLLLSLAPLIFLNNSLHPKPRPAPFLDVIQECAMYFWEALKFSSTSSCSLNRPNQTSKKGWSLTYFSYIAAIHFHKDCEDAIDHEVSRYCAMNKRKGLGIDVKPLSPHIKMNHIHYIALEPAWRNCAMTALCIIYVFM